MHKKFIEAAIKLAGENSEDGIHGPFGAVIVKDSSIVGRGWNQVVDTNDPTAHAEIVAIRDACKHLNLFSLDECILYSSCEPCPMCLSAIYWARISKIFFACNSQDAANAGFDDSRIYQELSLGWNERSITANQIERDKALAVFDKWIINPNKVHY